jgi:hypothetical protein
MPKNTHRNRVTHFLILFVFIVGIRAADLMSVKISQEINLEAFAAIDDELAMST